MKYIGEELHLFEKAQRWKRYWSSIIAPYMRGNVLEVGAGIGANAPFFANVNFSKWVCLEPDEDLLAEAKRRLHDERYEFVAGTIGSTKGPFDVIFYIDVLEHISDDADEMQRAAGRLKPGGTLIVLVPAHQFLFSTFDAAVGHFRRYDKRTLRSCIPPNLRREKLIYLDSVSLLASLANKLLLHQTMPTEAQIRTWDSLLVPLSRITDPMTGYRIGKSVLGIWTKE